MEIHHAEGVFGKKQEHWSEQEKREFMEALDPEDISEDTALFLPDYYEYLSEPCKKALHDLRRRRARKLAKRIRKEEGGAIK